MRAIAIIEASETVAADPLALQLAACDAGRSGGAAHLRVDRLVADAGGRTTTRDAAEALLARLRDAAANGQALGLVTASADAAQRMPVACAAADLVVILLDGTTSDTGPAAAIARVCLEHGTDVVFVLANVPVDEVEQDVILNLVQHGTVAPAALPAACWDTAPDGQTLPEVQSLWDLLTARCRNAEKFRSSAAELLGDTPADRREFQRVKLSWPAVAAGAPVQIRDISGSGVAFEGAASLQIGQTFELDIGTLGKIKADVVWRNRDAVGARFHITERGAERLAARLERLAEERRRQWFEARRQGAPEVAPAKPEPAATARRTADPASPPVLVVLNTKGGTGKSTICIHLAMALRHAGREVIGVDLDRQQATFATFDRRRRANPDARDLPSITVVTPGAGERLDLRRIAADAEAPVLVVDTPGQRFPQVRELLQAATSVIVPVNDSFVDLDILGTPAAEPGGGTGAPGLLASVTDLLGPRLETGEVTCWLVRNRLNPLLSRNKVRVADAVQELCQGVPLREAKGLSERVIYRELFDQGLTVFDMGGDGAAPLTLSHLSARQEIRGLANAVLPPAQSGQPDARDLQNMVRQTFGDDADTPQGPRRSSAG